MAKGRCPNCFGTGYVEKIPPYIEDEDDEKCLTCNGTGTVDSDVDDVTPLD